MDEIPDTCGRNEKILGLYQHKTSNGSKCQYLISTPGRYCWRDVDDEIVQPHLLHTNIPWLDSIEIGDKLWCFDNILNEWYIGILKEFRLKIDSPRLALLKVQKLNDVHTYLKEIHISLNGMTELDISKKVKKYINGDFYDDMICKSC